MLGQGRWKLRLMKEMEAMRVVHAQAPVQAVIVGPGQGGLALGGSPAMQISEPLIHVQPHFAAVVFESAPAATAAVVRVLLRQALP